MHPAAAEALRRSVVRRSSHDSLCCSHIALKLDFAHRSVEVVGYFRSTVEERYTAQGRGQVVVSQRPNQCLGKE